MHYSFTEKKRIRKSHSRSAPTFTTFRSCWLPSLNPTRTFCKRIPSVDARKNEGLQVGFHLDLSRSFRTMVSRASNSCRTCLGDPAFDVKECQQRGLTFASPLRAKVRLVILDKESPTKPVVKEMKEQEVYMGEIAAHDDHRFVRHQRYRARHRVAVAPFAGRVLRARPRQDALVGQAAVLGTYHSLPRLVARLRVRSEGHPVLPRRPPPQDAGDDPAEGHRHDARTDPGELLRVRQFQPALRRRARWNSCRAPAWRSRAFRHRRTEDGKVLVHEGQAHQRASTCATSTAAGIKHISVPEDYLLGRVLAKNIVDARHRRSHRQRQRRADRRAARQAARSQRQRNPDAVHERPGPGRLHLADPAHRRHRRPDGRAQSRSTA